MIARLIALPQRHAEPGAGRPGTRQDNTQLAVILSLLNRVAAVSDDASLSEAVALEQVFEEVCAYTGWPIGHLYVRTEDSPPRYVSHGVWRLEPGMDLEAIAEFRRLSEKTEFKLGVGLVGIIAETRKARAVEDVTVLPQFLRADAARRNDLRGFFGFPVLLGGECVAVAEFYGRQPGLLDETKLEIMAYVSSQIARIFERARFEKRKTRLMAQFQRDVQGAVGQLGGAANKLSDAAAELKGRCDDSAEACGKVTGGISDIAAAAGFLDGAMTGLTDAERETTAVTTGVVDTVHHLAGDLRAAVRQLEDSNRAAQDIGDITRNVSDIAGQVRMLGLNASIEAARAGDMGKGFGIVATEIKSLAQQSEAASNSIADQITGLQKTVRGSAATMASVAEKMDALMATVQSMSRVLDGQRAATGAIGTHVADSRETVAAISVDVGRMDEAMALLSDLALDLGRLATDLQITSMDVSESSSQFLGAMGS